jgi:exosortase
MAIDLQQSENDGLLSLMTPGTIQFSRTAAVLMSLLALLLGLLFYSLALRLEVRWRIDPSASHGYFVPLAAIYILVRRLRTKELSLPEFTRRFDVAVGLTAVLTGILSHLVGTLLNENSTGVAIDGFGLILVLLGLLWIFGGETSARRFRAAVMFLVFMIPLPFALQQPIGEALQQAVSVTSEASLSLMGLPIYREGFMLHLPGSELEVAEGCSGIRQTMVFLGIGAFLGLVGGSRIQCVVLLLLSLPVAIVANTIRITAMGLLVYYAEDQWIKGVFHDMEGLIGSVIGMVILFWLSRRLTPFLQRRLNTADPPAPAESASLVSDQSWPEHPGSTADARTESPDAWSARSVSLMQRAVLVIGLLVVGIVVDRATCVALARSGTTHQVALRKPLAEFPTSLAGWTGVDTPVSKDYFLYGDDHLNRVYRNDQTGQTVTLWMIYTTDGRDRGHHPQVCMRASGCQEDEARLATVPLPGEGSPAERFYFRKPGGNAVEWVTYWYHVFRIPGETTTSNGVLDALLEKFRSGRSGMTIQLFIPERTAADSAAADEFAAAVEVTVASQLLPPETTRSTRRAAFAIVNENLLRESD